MGTFIYFTEDQKRQANEVDLVEFLRRQGEKLLPSGRDYRLDSDHSVTIRAASGLTTRPKPAVTSLILSEHTTE